MWLHSVTQTHGLQTSSLENLYYLCWFPAILFTMCHILPIFYPFLPILSLVLVNNLCKTACCHLCLYRRRCPCLPCLGSRHIQARLPGSWRLRTNLINPNIPNGGTQQIRTPALSSPLHSSAAISPCNIELPACFLHFHNYLTI